MKHYEVIKHKVYCDNQLHEIVSFRKIRFYEKIFWKLKLWNSPSVMIGNIGEYLKNENIK